MQLIYCLARASEYRDNETGNHVIRVGWYAHIIGEELGLAPSHVDLLRQAATLHDLGKIGMPDSILLKPGKLTPDEFKLDAHHWLILHGRYTCKARKPECPSCVIRDLCEYRHKTPEVAG